MKPGRNRRHRASAPGPTLRRVEHRAAVADQPGVEPPGRLELREVTAENLDDVLSVTITTDQEPFVGTVADALAEAEETLRAGRGIGRCKSTTSLSGS